MELTNDFRVGVPVERAWAVLTDVELIAPCMPGAQLQEVEGDDYRGIVKIKVGPITAQYKGTAKFVERDDEAHRAVLRAEGRDTRGQGNANATITATLTPDGDGTAVTVATDLTVTGRVAQFGRGVMADVSAKLLGQFVDCLENKLLVDDGGSADASASGGGARDAGAAAAARTGRSTWRPRARPHRGPSTWRATRPPRGVRRVRRVVAASASSADRLAGTSGPSVKVVDSPEPEPVDLLEAAGAPVAKRALPAVAGLTFLWLLSLFIRRRRRRRRSS